MGPLLGMRAVLSWKRCQNFFLPETRARVAFLHMVGGGLGSESDSGLGPSACAGLSVR